MATKEALLTLLVIFVITFSVGIVMEFGIGQPALTGGATFGTENITGAVANETKPQENNTISVIIMYGNEQALDSALMEASQASTEVAALKGITTAEPVEIKYEYETSPAVAAEVTPEQLDTLQNSPGIEIYEDKQFQISLSQSVPFINATQVWPIQISSVNITGQGQTVCIVDTGINDGHPAFSGRIVAEYDFCADNTNCATNDTVAEDLNGHGTHVAGIVASNNSTYRGVAPGANLAIMKAANSGGTLFVSTITAAIEQCVAIKDQYNISVISMSFGDGGQYSTCPTSYPTIDAALDAAYNAGIFLVAASGNNGYSSEISYPACHSKVTAVGSVDRNADTIQSYSNSGNLLDLLAPGGSSGNQITSTSNDGISFVTKYGTSMATPHVAGVAALVLQYNKLRNGVTLTPTQLENKLKNTGKNIIDSRNNLTRARVDAAAAIAPIISFESPLNRSYINGNLDFNITVDSDITSATVTVNGTTYNLTNDLTSHWYNTTIPALGADNYTATFNVTSDFNSSKTVNFAVLANATAPRIILESPANNSNISRGSMLNFTITDDFGVDTVLVQFNGANSTLASPYDYNTANWTKGPQSITVFANNTAGISNSSSFAFNVSNSAPVFASGQPSSAYTILVIKPLSITANATDPDSDAVSYSVATNITSNYTTQISGGVLVWNWTPSISEIANYYVRFNASDNIISTIANTTITVRGDTAPALSAISNQTAAVGTSKTIYFYATDNDLNYGDSLSWSDNTSIFSVAPYNETTARAIFTPISSQVGTHDINITVTDSVGAKASRIFTLTIAESIAEEEGGGESGTSTGINYDNEKTFSSISPSRPVSFAPHIAGLGVDNIILETNAIVSGVTLKIRGLPFANVSAPGQVLQYFEIVATNLSNSNISSVTIQFTVAKSWLEQSGFNKSDIYLGQFSGSTWTELPPTITNETETDINCNAITTHLSTFAIAAEKPAEETLTNFTTPESSTARNFTTTAAATGAKQSIAGESKIAIVVVIVMSILAVLALAFYFLPKKPSVAKQIGSTRTKDIPDFGFNP